MTLNQKISDDFFSRHPFLDEPFEPCAEGSPERMKELRSILAAAEEFSTITLEEFKAMKIDSPVQRQWVISLLASKDTRSPASALNEGDWLGLAKEEFLSARNKPFLTEQDDLFLGQEKMLAFMEKVERSSTLLLKTGINSIPTYPWPTSKDMRPPAEVVAHIALIAEGLDEFDGDPKARAKVASLLSEAMSRTPMGLPTQFLASALGLHHVIFPDGREFEPWRSELAQSMPRDAIACMSHDATAASRSDAIKALLSNPETVKKIHLPHRPSNYLRQAIEDGNETVGFSVLEAMKVSGLDSPYYMFLAVESAYGHGCHRLAEAIVDQTDWSQDTDCHRDVLAVVGRHGSAKFVERACPKGHPKLAEALCAGLVAAKRHDLLAKWLPEMGIKTEASAPGTRWKPSLDDPLSIAAALGDLGAIEALLPTQSGMADRALAIACATGQIDAARSLLPAIAAGRLVQIMDFTHRLDGRKGHENGAFLVNALEASALCGQGQVTELLAKSGKFNQEAIDQALLTACIGSLPLDNSARRRDGAILDSFKKADQGALALLPFASEKGVRDADGILRGRGPISTVISKLLHPAKGKPTEQVADMLRKRRAAKGSDNQSEMKGIKFK